MGVKGREVKIGNSRGKKGISQRTGPNRMDRIERAEEDKDGFPPRECRVRMRSRNTIRLEYGIRIWHFQNMTVELEPDALKKLESAKLNPQETFSDVVRRAE